MAGAEQVRRDHIQHEASVRSIGVLYWLSGALLLVAGVGVVLTGVVGERRAINPFDVLALAIFAGVGIFSIVVGSAIRALRPWARTTSIVLSVIGLLGIPVGTLINGYVLYLLLAAKGKRLFEPDYEGIIAATPHIRYRTSIVVWIFVGLLGLLILAVVIAALFGG